MAFGRPQSDGASMNVLLLGVLLAHLGTYMVIPLLPIYLSAEKGFSIAEIGIILAVSPITFQAASLLGGWLADRLGRRVIIAAGAWVNGAAIVGYALFDSFWLFIAAGLVSGVGVGLNAPSTKAAIASLAASGRRETTAFSMRGVAANAGIAAAGVLTYYVLGGPSALVFYVAGAMFGAWGAVAWLLLPAGCGDDPCESTPLRTYASIARNRSFVAFSVAAVFIWALYFQLTLALPLQAEAVLRDPGMVSLIWTINSTLVIVLQSTVTRLFTVRMHPLSALAAGTLLIGAGLGSLFFAQSFLGLMISGIVFVLGEMLMMPTMDAAVSRLGAASMIGAFFGISNFVSGIGEGAGKFAGGQLLSVGTDSVLPWIGYVLAAVAIGAALVLLRRWQPMEALAASAESASHGEADAPEPGRRLADRPFGRKQRAK